MKIEYIVNTCDVDGLDEFGEILILIKDGEPVSHLDMSDGMVELEYVSDLLKPFGIDLEFESIWPDKNLVKKLNKYLKKHF